MSLNDPQLAAITPDRVCVHHLLLAGCKQRAKRGVPRVFNIMICTRLHQHIVGFKIITICKEASPLVPSYDRTVAWEIADAADDPRHKLLILLDGAQKCWELHPCLPTPSNGRPRRASRLSAEVKRHRLCKWVNPRLGDSTVKSLCVLASLQHCWQNSIEGWGKISHVQVLFLSVGPRFGGNPLDGSRAQRNDVQYSARKRTSRWSVKQFQTACEIKACNINSDLPAAVCPGCCCCRSSAATSSNY